MLFGLHLDERIMEWWKRMTNNFKLNSILLDTMLFTDGQVLIKEDRLQTEVHVMEEVTKRYKLKCQLKEIKHYH
jgi:hypothetical protein